MTKIVILAPDKELADLCLGVTNNMKRDYAVTILVAPAPEVVRVAREETKKGADAIISRGGNFSFIENANLGIPIVDIGISYQNLIFSFWKARKNGNKVAFVGYKSVSQSIKQIEHYLEELTKSTIISQMIAADDDINNALNTIIENESKDGLVFIGGNEVAEAAHNLGCPAVILKSSEENVIRALQEAQRIINITRTEKERANMFKAILDHISDGVISVDKSGKITVFNKGAQKLLTTDEHKVIGKEVTNTIFSPRINEVVKKGKPALGVLEDMGNITIVTNIAPIIVGNDAVGAVATFQDVTYLQQLEQQVRRKLSRQGLVAKYQFKDIVGQSQNIKNSILRAQKFSGTDYTIMITAETGSGKEMFAHSIHSASIRKNGPFVTINCASLPESLLEAELFGYSEGAFTGAVKGGRGGLFEQAHGGTIFLDEIGEVSGRLQVLFLRVLQEKEVRRIGDNQVIPVDVRIIAASNRKLKELVNNGVFRDDLYYRLNVLNLSIPPLRERQEDIPLLIHHFLNKLPQAFHHNITVSPEAMKLLQTYEWPGNVRQLENIIQRIIVIAENHLLIESQDVEQALEGELSYQNHYQGVEVNIPEAFMDSPVLPKYHNNEGLLSKVEKDTILQVLESVNWNRQEASRILGIGSTTLWRRLKRMNIESE